MQDMLSKSLKAFAVAGVVAIGAGCTVTPNEESAPAVTLADVQALAEEALRTANTADYKAATAKDLATEAQETANLALEVANGAQACCDANSRKMNVMFHEKSKGK